MRPNHASELRIQATRPSRNAWVTHLNRVSKPHAQAAHSNHASKPCAQQAVFPTNHVPTQNAQARIATVVGKKRAQCAPNVPRTGNLPLSGEIFTKCTLSCAKGGKKTRSRTFHGEIFFKCARRSVHLANISPDRTCFSVLASEIAHGVEILPGRTARAA